MEYNFQDMIDTEFKKGIYNLGRVYALLEMQDRLTDEQALLLDELERFDNMIVERDVFLHGVFKLGYEMQKHERFK